jgi:hypothetical protein
LHLLHVSVGGVVCTPAEASRLKSVNLVIISANLFRVQKLMILHCHILKLKDEINKNTPPPKSDVKKWQKST